MAIFHSVFVPCLAQRSPGQRVEFWDAMTNVIVYGFFSSQNLFFFLCQQGLFQDDSNKSLEPDFEGVTNSKSSCWEQGWEAMPKGKLCIVEVQQVQGEVNPRCWSAMLGVGGSGRADLVTDCFMFLYKCAKGCDFCSLCEKDCPSIFLHLLHLSLPPECTSAFCELLMLSPWAQTPLCPLAFGQ